MRDLDAGTQLPLRLTLADAPARPPVTRAVLTTWAAANDVELVFFDPPEHFDHAILGLVEGSGQEPAVLYDEAKVLAKLLAAGMADDDALDYHYSNTRGAYVGEATPRFLTRPWEEAPDVEET